MSPSPLSSSDKDTTADGTENGPGSHFKRVDKVYDAFTGKWTVSDTPTAVYTKDKEDVDAPQYLFTVERTLNYPEGPLSVPSISTTLLIHTEQLIGALTVVTKELSNLSWNATPFQILPGTLLPFLPRLKTYLGQLHLKKAEKEEHTEKELGLLIEFLESEYEDTLKELSNLISHGEITFQLLWGILLPDTILFSTCPTTSEPRAYRLLSATLAGPNWNILCDYVDNCTDQASSTGQGFGRSMTCLGIAQFSGAAKISRLGICPLQWYPDLPSHREKLIARGKKWAGLTEIHHVSYNGLAYRTKPCLQKFSVNGRVMIDRSSFAATEPNYGLQPEEMSEEDSEYAFPKIPCDSPESNIDGDELRVSLINDALLVATPILYGYSLTEKRWLEFNVERITPIEWNEETFKNLALDPYRKLLIQSLVESHAQNQTVDDFVRGKGLGLVINLFGPPGVGKSLTVEAISEHLRRPLYVVSSGDLGTDPNYLDTKLTKIFSMTPVWNAIVMIDEADVFLEKRATHDVVRNAMVAVFLRQIEYFRGILFLTTNRVKTFDQAFQSRIHLSLRYGDLSYSLKGQIWSSFLQKARDSGPVEKFSAEELCHLAEEDLNGRQIKNVVKMAIALAGHSNETLSFKHFTKTLEAMGDVPEDDEESDPIVRKVKAAMNLNEHEERLLGCIVDCAKIDTTFEDVCIPGKVIESLRTIVSLPLLFPSAFKSGVLKREAVGGILLYGPPGTGKTLVCRALARECGARMLQVKPSDVMDCWVGESEKAVKAIFSLAHRLAPCVIFIDEVDSLFLARQGKNDRKYTRDILAEFLQSMDGLKSAKANRDAGIVVIGATNRPQDLDDAVLRRLPARMIVDLPGEKEREQILSIHLRDEKLSEDLNLADIARNTSSYSGSDLKNICVSAAMASVKEAIGNFSWASKKASSEINDVDKSTTPRAPSLDGEAAEKITNRKITLQHFTHALDEVSPSSAASSHSELKRWHEEFGSMKSPPSAANKRLGSQTSDNAHGGAENQTSSNLYGGGGSKTGGSVYGGGGSGSNGRPGLYGGGTSNLYSSLNSSRAEGAPSLYSGMANNSAVASQLHDAGAGGPVPGSDGRPNLYSSLNSSRAEGVPSLYSGMASNSGVSSLLYGTRAGGSRYGGSSGVAGYNTGTSYAGNGNGEPGIGKLQMNNNGTEAGISAPLTNEHGMTGERGVGSE